MDNDGRESDEYFAHKYFAEVAANRSRLEAKEYTDDQIKQYKEHTIAGLNAIRETIAVLKEENKGHFIAVNNFNDRFREQSSEMARETEVINLVERVNDKVEARFDLVQGQVDEIKIQFNNLLTERRTILGGGNWISWFLLTVATLVIAYGVFVGGNK